jgi:hypothetical protein
MSVNYKNVKNYASYLQKYQKLQLLSLLPIKLDYFNPFWSSLTDAQPIFFFDADAQPIFKTCQGDFIYI